VVAVDGVDPVGIKQRAAPPPGVVAEGEGAGGGDDVFQALAGGVVDVVEGLQSCPALLDGDQFAAAGGVVEVLDPGGAVVAAFEPAVGVVVEGVFVCE
jgi:hypothetical protein